MKILLNSLILTPELITVKFAPVTEGGMIV